MEDRHSEINVRKFIVIKLHFAYISANQLYQHTGTKSSAVIIGIYFAIK